jgi:hypothetical protein
MFTKPKSIAPQEDDQPVSEENTDVLSVLLDEAEQAERASRPQPATAPPPRRLFNLD